MKVISSTERGSLPSRTSDCLPVVLYARADRKEAASAGAAVAHDLMRAGLQAADKAWDLLSIALSVIVADTGGLRRTSADGWTREFDLVVGVRDPEFWAAEKTLVESILRFLTTDRWSVRFQADAFRLVPKKVVEPSESCVSLLSGGLDSLVGALDLVAAAERPLAVSQLALGDGEKQTLFAQEIGGGLRHLQLNHNATLPGENERSQRARSFIFLTYGALAATTLKAYSDGAIVPLIVPENGFISINPPLTEARIGSLSTRTTHPVFLSLFQRLLNNAGLRVRISNPYRFKTKGEMLAECKDQQYLVKRASEATSCGRFRRNGFRHCGRCVPCLIRRASFMRWGSTDDTAYVYGDLGRDDKEHALYNDVRSAALAVLTAQEEGLGALLRTSLVSDLVEDKDAYRGVVQRGLGELAVLLRNARVL